MVEFKINFGLETGMHARPAGELVRKITDLKSKVEISVEGKENAVEGDGIFAVMSLGIKKGDTVILRVYGDTEISDAKDLESFMTEKFSK